MTDLRVSLLMAALLTSVAGAGLAQDEVALQPIVVDGIAQGYVAGGNGSAGTKTSTPIQKVPQAINTVTAAQIADQGAQSVAEALRFTPGVFTEYRGTSNQADEMYVRGFGYVPRYLDGLTFAGASSGRLDPFLLDRVEVVKGPASVLYGQASPGGIVNMASKLPEGRDADHVRLTFGSRNQAEVGVDSQRQLSDTLDARFVAHFAQQDSVEQADGEGIRSESYAFLPSLRWRPTAATALTFSAIVQDEPGVGLRNFREASGTTEPTAYGYIPRDFFVSDPDFEVNERETYGLQAQLEHRFAPNVTFRQKLRALDIHTRTGTLVWGALDDDGKTISRSVTKDHSDLSQITSDTQLEVGFGTGALRHTLLAGLDVQRTESDKKVWRGAASSIDWTNPIYGVTVPNAALSSDTGTVLRQTGLYLQDQMEWGGLTVSAGLRHDTFDSTVRDHVGGTTTDLDGSATTGRLGALYTFDNGIAPYISYSTSFEPVTTAPESGQSPFDPTEGKQVELGVKWMSPNERLFLQAAAFDIEQTNVLTRETYTDPYRQIGKIRMRGIELEGRGQVTDALSVIASYSTLDAEVVESDVATEVGKSPARLPEVLASLWVKYDTPAGFGVAGGLRYIGESQGNAANTFQVSAVTLIDLAFDYDLGRLSPQLDGLSAQVNVRNLEDKVYTASCASAYACFIGTERTISASLDWRF